MELSRKRAKTLGNAGLLGLAAASCAACCAPLLIPAFTALLASFGLAGLAALEQYWLAGALFGASAAGVAVMLRKRRQKEDACSVPTTPGGQA